jgi:hypothetical protein
VQDQRSAPRAACQERKGSHGPGENCAPVETNLLDAAGWAKEGLIDLLMGDQWASRERTLEQIAEQVRGHVQQVAGTNVEVSPELCCFEGKEAMMPKIGRGLPAALEAGASKVSFTSARFWRVGPWTARRTRGRTWGRS